MVRCAPKYSDSEAVLPKKVLRVLNLKILLVGDWHSNLHEEAVRQALEELGQEVVCFPWHHYFKPDTKAGKIFSPFFKVQNKYLFGPTLKSLNEDLVSVFKQYLPDVVFVYRGTHIFPETLIKIKGIRSRSVLVGYNNDDPFSPVYPKWFWRHFIAGLPLYDLALAYRSHNIEDFKKAGARRVKLLRSWYVPSKNRPVELSPAEQKDYACDVVFAGHFEDDGRLDYLEAVVERGWKLKLHGHDYGWNKPLSRSRTLRHLLPVRTLWGEDYNKAICGSKVALCFLSKLNRDSYTRRCFEIPAAGTLLLSEYSHDLSTIFEAGKEADFFQSTEEMVEKLEYYLKNEKSRRAVALAGRKRLIADGHDIVSRMRQVLDRIVEGN